MKMLKKSIILGLLCGLFCSNIFSFASDAATKDLAPMKNIHYISYSGNTYRKKNLEAMLEPPIITSLKYNKDKTKITLSWKKIDKATMYFIYKKNKNTWKKIATTTSTSFTTDIVYKNSNTYTVKAVASFGNTLIYGSYESPGITAPHNDYSDLNILFEGDSITHGKCGTSGYPDRVQLLLGCHIANYAVNGSTTGPYNNPSNKDLLYRLENGITTYKNYDVICIAVGTNDYAFNKKLGTANDTKENKSFNGYMNSLIKEIRSQNSRAPIVLITPIYRGLRASVPAGYHEKNTAGYTLGDICNTIKEMPNRYDNVYVYDSKSHNIINESNAKDYLYDMLHPNDTGYALIGNSISVYLKKYILEA